jgi:hypothetical protein
MCPKVDMHSEKLLLKALSSLTKMFEEFYRASNVQDRQKVFESAMNQCNKISAAVKSGEINLAKNQWRALMYFSNDSIGPSEEYLAKYEPLRQKIINFGLQ